MGHFLNNKRFYEIGHLYLGKDFKLSRTDKVICAALSTIPNVLIHRLTEHLINSDFKWKFLYIMKLI